MLLKQQGYVPLDDNPTCYRGRAGTQQKSIWPLWNNGESTTAGWCSAPLMQPERYSCDVLPDCSLNDPRPQAGITESRPEGCLSISLTIHLHATHGTWATPLDIDTAITHWSGKYTTLLLSSY
ncbi:hypothetical protein RRG08_031249 [Elysia crispata]|uniref:Uncharacterized protein n=1 Tax=Elysia crispata TaxID=231223 RepID=A0AAE1E0Q5_9GAST|nr:hypothetical protein RRG08_031249 [Elysia crispata]